MRALKAIMDEDYEDYKRKTSINKSVIAAPESPTEKQSPAKKRTTNEFEISIDSKKHQDEASAEEDDPFFSEEVSPKRG